MKAFSLILNLLAIASVGTLAQGAALDNSFTYQGRLQDGTGPANGIYDFRCSAYDTATDGSMIGSAVTRAGVGASNGLFTVSLDFGTGVFNGDARWLQIEVRTNGGGAFTALTPRQPLTAAPQAVFALQSASASSAAAAATVPWSGLVGVPAGLADGVDADTTYSAGTGLTLAGTSFSLNTAYTDDRYWKLGGNAGTSPATHFLGTTDNRSLELRVNNVRALRLMPNPYGGPGIVGGSPVNRINSATVGSVIGGGGAIDVSGTSYTNSIDSSFGTIGGGANNTIGFFSDRATISGGTDNAIQANGDYGVIAGGRRNTQSTNATAAVIGGGDSNTIGTNADYAVIPGGQYNVAEGQFSFAVGRRAKARHEGTFVWADSSNADFASTGDRQFLVRAAGGVGINVNNPQSALHVGGAITADSVDAANLSGVFTGNGSGLTNVTVAQLGTPDGSNPAVVQVSSSGQVGIGTNAPKATLHLADGAPVVVPALQSVIQGLTGSYTNFSRFFTLAAHDNLLAVLSADYSAFTLIDISTPTNPVFRSSVRDGTGSFNDLDLAGAIALSENLLAVASYDANAVTLADVSNPANPLFRSVLRDGVGGFNDLAGPTTLEFSGNLLVVGSVSDDAITLVDVSNPAAPVRRATLKDGLGGFNELADPRALAQSNGLLAVATTTDNAVSLIDISNPASPVLRAVLKDGLGGFNELDGPISLAISGNMLAVVSLYDQAVTLVDIANPASPQPLTTLQDQVEGYPFRFAPQTVRFMGHHLLISVSVFGNGVLVMDVSAPAVPVLRNAILEGYGDFDKMIDAVPVVAGNLMAVDTWDQIYLVDVLATQPLSLATRDWVAIGTTTPFAPLHVHGNMMVESADWVSLRALRLELGGGTATGDYATAMGNYSTASGDCAVALGYNSIASGTDSTAMGRLTTASGAASTALGYYARASGEVATALGRSSTAAGDYSFAAGRRAKANHHGAFVWADSANADFASQRENEFAVRAGGGVRIDSDAGVSLNEADGPLITRGWDPFATNAPSDLQGHGRWGLFMEPSYLVLGIPERSSRYFEVAKYATNGTRTALMTVDQSAKVTAGEFAGNGAGLTGLNASQLSTGSIPDARLSANVALLTSGASFNGSVTAQEDLSAQRLNIGEGHVLSGAYASIAGGYHNTNRATDGIVAGGAANSIEVNSGGSFIGGGRNNAIAASSEHCVIAGGAFNSIRENVRRGFIGAGYDNELGDDADYSTIGGGYGNTVLPSANYATIPGGIYNRATNYAFAAGYNARALHTGSFVWSDAGGSITSSTNEHSVTFRARGGYRLFTATANVGASLAPGSGAWASMCDRTVKENVEPVDPSEVLAKVVTLPLSTWNYKTQDEKTRHIGPMAQDFHAAFGLGDNETTITTVDADGVALAAIQGLNAVVKEKEARIQALEQQNQSLEARLAALEQLIKGDLQEAKR